MTHEQKPESAEFRTREAQIASHFGPHFLADFTEEGLRQELIEAEARGAAEQRRKDAEGVEPVGYVRPDMMEFFRQSKALFTSASIIPKRDETHTEALYTSPANVAALEDRVKELEGALADVSKADDLGAKPDYHRCPVDQLAFELAWMCEEAELSANDLVIINREKLRTIARRVVARAAIREGGEG